MIVEEAYGFQLMTLNKQLDISLTSLNLKKEVLSAIISNFRSRLNFKLTIKLGSFPVKETNL